MEKNLIRTENLCYRDMIYYPDIRIGEGDTCFITGKSGTGKSTLLRLLNGTVTQSSGNVFYRGASILSADTVRLRREVMLVSQSVYVFDGSIKENFSEFYRFRDMELPEEPEIKAYMGLCCLDFDLDKNCTTMSGGEKQRLYLAVFLSFLPKVLMLDEPTSALDSQNSDLIMKNVTEFCSSHDITLLVVSHDQGLTNKFARQIISLGQREENHAGSGPA